MPPLTELEPPVAVLIVDDQPPVRLVAGTVVSLLAGWSVVAEASSGAEAVTAAALTRPDVVLMDINLPGISGIEATRQITTAGLAARVVLLSTYQADDLPADAMESGVISLICARKTSRQPA